VNIEDSKIIHNNQNPVFQINEFPLVSVIVPAHNAQQYIGATLQSLIHQSYPYLEIIVTDDGSRDRTADIVRTVMIKDRRIKLLQQANCGVAAARNLAIHHSKGSFIAPVDADDICFPKKIEKLVDCIQYPGGQVGLAYSWSATIDPYGNVIGKTKKYAVEGEVFEHLLFSNFPGNGSSCLIRKNCFDVIGLYNTTFFSQNAQGCEDYDMYLRIAEKFQFKLHKGFLTGYRRTGHSMSDNYKAMERSMQLVFRDQKIRTPWLPAVVLNWAFAYYSLWLSSVAAKQGFYHDSITYLIKAAQYDSLLIQNSEYLRFYIRILKQGLKRMLLPCCTFDNRKMYLQIAQQPIVSNGNYPNRDFEKISVFNPKKSSLTLLKENRRMMARHLVRQASIQNCHSVR
jgi:glycosyltransferase involved in cell wall biosynthesis